MYQFLKFEYPIPSCEIYNLEFKDNKWYYIYALNTPFELTNENQQELIIYEYISDLHLKLPDSVHPESVNLKVKTLNEYLIWLEKQRNEDIKYRKQWIEKHPNVKPNTVILEKKDYTHEELLEKEVHYIASIVEENEQNTTFAAV